MGQHLTVAEYVLQEGGVLMELSCGTIITSYFTTKLIRNY